MVTNSKVAVLPRGKRGFGLTSCHDAHMTWQQSLQDVDHG